MAVYEQGRTRTIYLPKASRTVVEEYLQLAQGNAALLSEIAQINLELLRRRALG